MSAQLRKNFGGVISCANLPDLEEDRLQLGLERVVDINLSAGSEEDSIHVILSIPSEMGLADNGAFQEMVRRSGQQFEFVVE